MSEVKALKLVSGEELVVEITEENETAVTFKNPVAAVLQRSNQTGGAAPQEEQPQEQVPQGEMEQPEISPEEEQFLQKMQELQEILALGDDEFMQHVEDSLMQRCCNCQSCGHRRST